MKKFLRTLLIAAVLICGSGSLHRHVETFHNDPAIAEEAGARPNPVEIRLNLSDAMEMSDSISAILRALSGVSNGELV